MSTYGTRAVKLLNQGSPTLLLFWVKATTIIADWLARRMLKNHNNWYIEDSKLVRTFVVRKKSDAWECGFDSSLSNICENLFKEFNCFWDRTDGHKNLVEILGEFLHYFVVSILTTTHAYANSQSMAYLYLHYQYNILGFSYVQKLKD